IRDKLVTGVQTCALPIFLDRQLPHGGWNYGNTLMFGKELHPMPESTGAALSGLAGMVDQDNVSRSLDYLQGEVDRLRTPISLGRSEERRVGKECRCRWST